MLRPISFHQRLANHTTISAFEKFAGSKLENNNDRPNNAIRVLVADNSEFHTQLLAGALNRYPDLQVVTSDLNVASLVTSSRDHRINVFVISAFAAGDPRRGYSVLQELRASHPGARAVMLLDASDPESILDAFRAGAKGIFNHQESPDMLLRCIRRVHEGQAW